MSLVEKIKGFKVFFAVPAYDCKVDSHFLKSMLATQRLLDSHGIVNGLAVLTGDCYIQRARNHLSASFLSTDFTHLFFIDSDMGWEPEKVLKLLAHDKEFICGGYQTKKDGPPVFTIDPIEYNGGWHGEGGLIKLRGGLPRGSCALKEVFSRS